jgi:hypothetical protein
LRTQFVRRVSDGAQVAHGAGMQPVAGVGQLDTTALAPQQRHAQ